MKSRVSGAPEAKQEAAPVNLGLFTTEKTSTGPSI